jgi:poly-gamma-glutamate synthesis protein (capsule biosynthesis protein)
MRITVGGDFCPVGPIGPACQRGDVQAVFGDLLPELERSDLLALNLECPLIERGAPILKSGPVLGVSQDHVAVLRAAGFELVGLANNHAMDHGATGLASTIEACGDAGIATFGAGPDLVSARRAVVRSIDGFRVAFMGMAEHEFGIARRNDCGTSPLDPIEFVRNVRDHGHEWDYLIVLVHGGNEYYPYPRPSLMNACRFLVEQGANAVICQHSHAAGCYEAYADGHIVYGQGNFLFDRRDAPASWYEGLLLALDVDLQARSARLQLIPIQQSLHAPGIQKMSGPRASTFLGEIESRSSRLSDEAFVQEQWDRFCEQNRTHYFRRLGTPNRAFRALDRLTGYTRFFYSRVPLRAEHLNLIRCESHREVLINVLSRGFL